MLGSRLCRRLAILCVLAGAPIHISSATAIDTPAVTKLREAIADIEAARPAVHVRLYMDENPNQLDKVILGSPKLGEALRIYTSVTRDRAKDKRSDLEIDDYLDEFVCQLLWLGSQQHPASVSVGLAKDRILFDASRTSRGSTETGGITKMVFAAIGHQESDRGRAFLDDLIDRSANKESVGFATLVNLRARIAKDANERDALQEQALKVLEHTSGSNNPLLMQIQLQLATDYVKDRKFAKAKPLKDQAVKILETGGAWETTPYGLDPIIAGTQLLMQYEAAGQYDEINNLFRTLFKIAEQQGKETSETYLRRVLGRMLDHYESIGQSDKAKSILEFVVSTMSTARAVNHAKPTRVTRATMATASEDWTPQTYQHELNDLIAGKPIAKRKDLEYGLRFPDETVPAHKSN